MKRNKICHFYRKLRHWARDCVLKKAREKRQVQKNEKKKIKYYDFY